MVKDTSLGRYRFDKHFRLPKFGAVKNPFEAPGQTESVPASKAVPAPASKRPPAPVAAPIEKSPAEVKAAALTKTQRLPETAPVKAKTGRQRLRKTAAELLARCKLWAAKLNPLSWLSRRKAGAKAASPKAERQAIQPELSLEKIKVARNDLNDADLEVVAAEKPADAGDTPAAKLKRKAMNCASSRLMHASQT